MILILTTVVESDLVYGSLAGVFLGLIIFAMLGVYIASLLYLTLRPVHQNLSARTSVRMKRPGDANLSDEELDDAMWNNDDLLPDPDTAAVYSL